MKTLIRPFLVVALCVIVFAASASPTTSVGTNQTAAANSPPHPALEAAKAISMITGVAISPLLGVGAVGAWDYFRVPSAQRTNLPWYAQPWFWLPALLVVALVGLKDAAGTALPPGLKKPLDALEVMENKISGLVAAGAFVPLVVSIFGPHPGGGGGAMLSGNVLLATIDWSTMANILVTPIAVVAFALVWLVSHAIHILILLSPWGVVDAALKLARVFLMALVAGVSFANPYAGAVFSVIIIVIAYFLAGWSFRLMVCGCVFAWDILTIRRTRILPEPDAIWMFTAAEFAAVPVRTHGKLARKAGGQLVFDYRPWLLLRTRTLVLPNARYAVGRGLFHPEILAIDVDTQRETSVFALPPRYRTHEEALARLCGLTEVRDIGLLKGFKAVWTGIRDLFGRHPKGLSLGHR